MILRPVTEHADKILSGWWEANDEQEGLPADLSRRAETLTGLAARLTAVSEDGQMQGKYLLNYGWGDLADVISAAWVDYFVQMAQPAAQVADAAAALTAWAAATGTWLAAAAEIVWRTEGLIDAERIKAAATGTDPQPVIDGLIEDAHSEVTTRGTATITALNAALPAWAGPPKTIAPPGGRGVLPAPESSAQQEGSGRGVLPAAQGTPSETGRGMLPAATSDTPAASEPGRGVLPTPQQGVHVAAAPNTAPAGATPTAPATTTPGSGAPSAAGSPAGAAAPPTRIDAPAGAASGDGTPSPAATQQPTAPPVGSSGTTATTTTAAASYTAPSSPAPSSVAAPTQPAEHSAAVPIDGVVQPSPVAPIGAAPASAAAVPSPPPPAAALPPPVAPAAPVVPVSPLATPPHVGSSIAPPPITKPVVVQSFNEGIQIAAEPAAVGGGVVAIGGQPAVPLRSSESDLELLRRLLRAVGGGGMVAYAAAVLVSDGRRQVVLTSNRGRGWMPPGSVVPSETASPWDHPESEVWEGLHDPCRVLREYAAATDVDIAAMVATRGMFPDGIPAECVDAAKHPHPELLHGRLSTRVQWQAAALAEAVQEWPRAEDSHRQAMSCAWLAHERAAADPEGSRAAVLAAVFDRARQGVQTPEGRTAGAPWKALAERWTSLGFEEVRARVDPAEVAVGALDDRGAVSTRLTLATLYADEAVLALLRPGSDALEVALYSAAMLGVGAT